MDKHEGGGVDEKLMKEIDKADCKKLISQTTKDIKMIQYACERVVSAEEDRILPLKVNPSGDGTKAPFSMLEILPDCTITCKIDVNNRKLPLKLNLQYEMKETYDKNKNLSIRPRPSTAVAKRET